MPNEISAKSNKNEILDAYQTLLEKAKEAKKADKKAEKEESTKQEVLQIATGHTVEGIVQNLSSLKVQIMRSFDQLEDQLIGEHKTLTHLQQAIGYAQKELEDIHKIKACADSLTALVMTQEQKKSDFERDFGERKLTLEQDSQQKRALWKKEQDEYEQFRKEEEQMIKKARQREQDEYIYKRDLERQKEGNVYEAQKEQLEKELVQKQADFEQTFAERERALISQENELKELRQKTQNFPKELQKSVQDAEQAVVARLEFKYQHEAQLAAKEMEGERKLHQHVVGALEAKIKQQDEHVKQLTDKTNQAGIQVQEIAVKAIEGAARQRWVLNTNQEKERAT